MSNNKQTAVEWLISQLQKSKDWHRVLNEISQMSSSRVDIIEKAKELESYQKNNLLIHIHEGMSNTHVYIENGIVHVKPIQKPQTTENGKSSN